MPRLVYSWACQGKEGVSGADERDRLLAPALWAARYSCATAPQLRDRAQARFARSDCRRVAASRIIIARCNAACRIRGALRSPCSAVAARPLR